MWLRARFAGVTSAVHWTLANTPAHLATRTADPGADLTSHKQSLAPALAALAYPCSDRKISTRRLAARPASVSLLATGSCEPRPVTLTRDVDTPREAR